MSIRMHSPLALLLAAVAVLSLLGPDEARAELFVVDAGSDAVRMYDEATGQFLGNFADNTNIEAARQLQFPRSAAFGPDGSLFVSGYDSFALLRYTPIGGNRGKFADASTSPTFGQPSGVAAHGGLIYVADATLDNVKRYDPAKPPAEAFVGVFASGGGLDNPEGIAFGPDGNLYVASEATGSVLRFDGTSGASLGALANGASGLQGPRDVSFGPDGHLYVADPGLAGKIPRFDVAAGAFTDFFVNNDASLSSPRSLTFGPDEKLYVGDAGNGSVRRYTATGAPDGVLVAAGAGGLSSPTDLIFAEPGGTKLNLAMHGWGVLALAGLFGLLCLRVRRRPAGRPEAG